MSTRSREPDKAEWLRNMQQQPENVARLLAYESRFGHLVVDEQGYVWNGGIGPGYGTSFKLTTCETPMAPAAQDKWTLEPADPIPTTIRPAHRKRA